MQSVIKKVLCVAVLACLLCLCALAADSTVVYIADGGTGDGTSASAPLGSLSDAYTAIGNNDATIVVCGEYTVTEPFVAQSHTGVVTITSVFGGVDYRKTNKAAFTLAANYYCGGETLIDNIKVNSAASYVGLFGNYKKMTVGAGVTTGCSGENTVYPCIIGGGYRSVKNASGEVVVNGGTWQRIRLGNSAGSPTNSNVSLTFNNGTVMELVYLSGGESHSGDFLLTVNGGTLKMGIVGASMSLVEQENEDGTTTLVDTLSYSGNMTITINGGNICGRIRPQYTKYGTLSGSWNININGGEFSHCAEIVGTSSIGTSMTSTLSYGKNVDINEKETGTYSFTNPIRYWGADPWIFFHDGAYYYTTTAGDYLTLYKAANIGDLSTAAGTVIYDPEDGKEWSCNMWSPEIHYFSADMVGEKYAGWYLLLCSDD